MFNLLYQFATKAEVFGLPAVLSIICLLQYSLHLYYRYAVKDRENQLLTDLKQMNGEMNALQRERYLAQMENLMLREIFTSNASGKTVELLLKKLVPHASEGFAAFYCFDGETNSLFEQRGLSQLTASQLKIEDSWIETLTSESYLRIAGQELLHSPLGPTLSSRERKKLQELHLFLVADELDRSGIILSTHLLPNGMEHSIQLQITSRILESITGSIRQTVELNRQQDILRLTQEKLALRTIADQHHDTPHRLLDEYLSRLTSLIDADRGTLMICTNRKSTPFRVMSRQGSTSLNGVETMWHQHEMTLAESIRGIHHPVSLGPHELQEIGIDSLIGSVLALPLHQQGKMIGLICLARKDPGIFSALQINLSDWAASYLSEELFRILDRVETERRASTDGLTDLANRRTFDARIIKEIEQASMHGRECALGLFDLDHFKKINDTYGHQAGDEVLRIFSRLLEQETKKVRATDVPLVARYGGEEMAVLLPGVGMQGASRIFESIRSATAQLQIVYQLQLIPVTVSVGIACFPRHAQSAEQLIEAADKALYQAKKQGRNRIGIISTAATEQTNESLPLPTAAAEI